jgi:hypothetical protein
VNDLVQCAAPKLSFANFICFSTPSVNDVVAYALM